MASIKGTENRVRRKADRRGFEVHKSRRRDPRAKGYGVWTVVDRTTNTPVTEGSLTWIEHYLDERPLFNDGRSKS